jgi:iron complex outermembrane receptor protein
MSQLKPIMAGVLAAFGTAGLLASLPAGAQQAQTPASAQKIERVEVTGSSIKRVDTETVAPIQVITREDIQRSGQATISEVLRNVPANTGGSFGESFSNSFAPGAAGISLRGLGQKTTLVLINGRRTAGYGFAQNLQDTFVDLNSIPSAAVERVEILKDGASAITGLTRLLAWSTSSCAATIPVWKLQLGLAIRKASQISVQASRPVWAISELTSST